MFTAALFTIAKAWKQHRFHWQTKDKEVVVIYRMEYYSAIKKNTLEPVLMR